MKSTHVVKGSILVASTLSLLVACGPPPSGTPTPSTAPSSTASEAPSAAPSEAPSAAPSETPSTAPSATASEAPSSTPTTAPSATTSTAPTSVPTAAPTSDISVVEKTTFNGKVYDDTNAPLDGVKVVAKSLSSSVAYEETTTTAGGAYAFNNAPSGIQIQITASKSGYATRSRVEVLKSNKTGDPDANRYDFGTDGGSSDFGVEYNSLSDKPEVVSATPGRNASGIAPDTSFVIKFSEPMDTDTVEQNFGVYAGTDEDLSVDVSLDGASKDNPESGDLVWDESAFNVSWNSDDTEVTFTFKDEQQLLTDTESENVPDYLISFMADDDQLKDKSGITREFDPGASDGDADAEGYFKLTSGDFEAAYKFSIDTDEVEPQIDSINALTEENGNTEGDEIEVEFSEPMVFYTEDPGEVRGNVNGGSDDEDPIDSNNYFVTVNGGTEFEWGMGRDGSSYYSDDGFATFDTTDRTHKTVLLRMYNSSNDVFEPGDKINVRVSSSVVDPAGNSVDSGNDEEDDTAS